MAASKEECWKAFNAAMQFANFANEKFQSDILDFYGECLRNKRKTGKGRPKKNRRPKGQTELDIPVIGEELTPEVNQRKSQRSAAKKASSIITRHASMKLNSKIRNANSSSVASSSSAIQEDGSCKEECVETSPASEAPSFKLKRIRTKSRLFNSDDSVPLKKKRKFTTPQRTITKASEIKPAKCRQARRKSDSRDDSSCLQEKPRLDLSEQETTEKFINFDHSTPICFSNNQANLQIHKESPPSTSGGCKNTSEENKENAIPLIQQRVFVDAETPAVPEGRVLVETRTRTKERKESQRKAALLLATEKEVSGIMGKNKIPVSLIKNVISGGKKNAPLTTNNQIFSPFKVYKEKKDDDKKAKVMSKLDAAALKKKNHMQNNVDELKRKNGEKELKRLAVEQARNREKQLKLEKFIKEQATKEKQIEKARKLKEEKVLQMKQLNNAQLKGAEERRLKEEELKRARIKKIEEEKKRLEEERLRQLEEVKNLHGARLVQQAAAKPFALKEKVKKVLPDNKMYMPSSSQQYNMTPNKSERVPKKPKNSRNYGISDDNGDSTDDERNPKKIIPKWAELSNRREVVIAQGKIFQDTLTLMFPQHIDLNVVKSSARCRMRASSAVWDSPKQESPPKSP